MSGDQFAKFAADLVRASTGIDIMGARAAERVGKGALAFSESVVPVDSGETKRRLSLRVKGSTATVTSLTTAGFFQEVGTSVMAPQPFISPAVDVWGPRLVQEVEAIRDEVIKDIG